MSDKKLTNVMLNLVQHLIKSMTYYETLKQVQGDRKNFYQVGDKVKILLLSLFIILISTVVYANDVFPDRELKRLQVVEINIDAGKAWIQDADGNEAEISIGDTIGIETGIVVRINEASITVQTGNTRSKMPIVYGFE